MEKHHVEVIHSVSELIEFGQRPSEIPLERQASREREYRGDDWAGTATWDDAVKLAQTGWQAKRREVQAMVTAAIDDVHAQDWGFQAMEFNYTVSGGDVDVQRFLAGEPENMLDWAVAADSRAVRVCMGGAVSAAVKAEDIIRRGAVVAALVEALAECGIAVELWVQCAIAQNVRDGYRDGKLVKLTSGNSATVFTRIKEFGEPLDVDKMVYATAHPSFLRRLCFAVFERLPASLRMSLSVPGWYGFPCTTEDYSPIGGADITLPNLLAGNRDPILDDPIGWIRGELSKLFRED